MTQIALLSDLITFYSDGIFVYKGFHALKLMAAIKCLYYITRHHSKMPLDTTKFTLVKTAKYSVVHPLSGCKPMKPVKVSFAKPDASAPAPAKAQADDDDDLFGDDDEDDDEAAKESARKRVDAAKAAKCKKEKAKPVERTSVVIEVKPWEAETDLEALAIKIKATKIEGLSWGEGHKLVDVAFGIKKLLVQCVIIDDMVALDDITDAIEKFEGDVQSVDVATMNKI
uniref:EF1 guanine nucleotide exchange domaincontaining protein putative n=1 Tax=Albugo laibachii Nc14 TaxID=890382 RepID=F0WC99_9STRA|nr:EF1 guanine nucleotide exchange domaincontaining protein putative [Albugo laibachii Nc14]|eukprot:CCA18813.1 EF1 guanine nucleotide exchange domaincontaining protein putative [Albugo laibachii Nc14]